MGELHKLQQFFSTGNGYAAGGNGATNGWSKTSPQESPATSRGLDGADGTLNINSLKESMQLPAGEEGEEMKTYLNSVLSRLGEEEHEPRTMSHVISKVEYAIDEEQRDRSQRQQVAQALKQRAAVLRLKTNVLDHEKVFKAALTRFNADNERLANEACLQERKASLALQALDKEYASEESGAFATDVGQVAMPGEDLLSYPPLQIASMIADLKSPDPAGARQLLDILLTSTVSETHMKELKRELQGCGVGEQLTAIVVGLHKQLNSGSIQTGVTLKSLEASSRAIPSLAAEVNKANEDLQRVQGSGNASAAELEAHQRGLNGLLERYLAIIEDRLGLLRGKGVNGRDMAEVTNEFRSEADKVIATSHKMCEETDKQLDVDAKRLIERHTELKNIREQQHQATINDLQACTTSLEENTATRHSITEKIKELTKQLAECAHERVDLVNKRIEIMEEDALHQQVFEAQCTLQRNHLQTMQTLKDKVANVAQLHKYLDRFIATIIGGIKQKMQRMEAELSSYRVEEFKSHLDVFTKYYLFNGDRIVKKDECIKECTRLLRHYQSSSDHAVKVGDPQARMYMQHVKDLVASRSSCLSSIDECREKCEKRAAAFEATAAALRELNIDFTHPKDALASQTAKTRQQSITHRLRLVEADTQDYEREQHELRQLMSGGGDAVLNSTTGSIASRP